MRRRECMMLGGGAAAYACSWPLAAWAQQPSERRILQSRLLLLQAEALASKIAEFINGIESHMGWTTQLSWNAGNTIDERRFDGVRLLRQVPAITELSQLDATGKEQLRMSRLAMDAVGRETDFSQDPKFTEALANKVYYGPVYFREFGTGERRSATPYMTLSLAGARRDAGVSVAEVNLLLIQDLVKSTKVGAHGVAYVAENGGRVFAHPDVSLVQRDFSSLAHVRAARAGSGAPRAVQIARDINGREALAASAPVAKPKLGWLVFVELPVAEADAPAQ
jgi:two-component system, NtrC family, sensor kinase